MDLAEGDRESRCPARPHGPQLQDEKLERRTQTLEAEPLEGGAEQRGKGGESEKSQGKEEPEKIRGGAAREGDGEAGRGVPPGRRKKPARGWRHLQSRSGGSFPARLSGKVTADGSGERQAQRGEPACHPPASPTHLQTVARQYTCNEVVKAGGPYSNKHALHREGSQARLARAGCDERRSRELQLRVQWGRRKLARDAGALRKPGLCSPVAG